MSKVLRSLFLGVLFSILSLPVLVNAQINNLYVLDPQQPWNWYSGTIDNATLSVEPKGVYMQYGLYLTLSAKNGYWGYGDSLEVVLNFTLPEGAIVTGSWLWNGDKILKGRVMDRWTASNIYEDIVNRRRDPSILYKNPGGQYELRVYPLYRKGSRKVKITYLLPANWSAQAISAPLPNHILQSTQYPPSTFNIVTWSNRTWKYPRIAELPGAKFLAATDDWFGNHFQTAIPWSSVTGPLNIAYNNPVVGGTFISRYQDGDQGWYQMAFLPSEVLETAKSRKVAVLLDYDASKTAMQSSDILNTVRSALIGNLAPTDSFNVLISRVDIQKVSDTWLPADSATIATTFENIKKRPLSGYSNLAALLSEGIKFIQQKGKTGNLLLVSSSDQYGEPSVANLLLKDLQALTSKLPPIFIEDLANLNYSYHWVEGKSFYGNDYLYLNISRLSSGAYATVRDGKDAPTILYELMSSVGGVIGTFDLHTSLATGFSYGRFTSNTFGDATYLNHPVVQVGRYYGNFPFTLEASGLYDTLPFTYKKTVTDADVVASDSTLITWWSGRQMGALEKSTQSNNIVSQIIDISIDQSILSEYTAFLALEQYICDDCTGDPDDPTPIEDETPQNEESTIKVYPNPFSDRAHIVVSLATPISSSSITVRIYNVMGQVVATLKVPASSSSTEYEFEWDGTNDAGQPVADGTYFLVFDAPGVHLTTTLIRIQ